MAYSYETVHEVWDNSCGARIAVGPDRDELGLIEIRDHSPNGVIDYRMSFRLDQARLVARAILDTVAFMEKQ